jgi:hypothetical protein
MKFASPTSSAFSNLNNEYEKRELVDYDGEGYPPKNKNAAAQRLWWEALGRTLATVLDHIAAGKEPWLRYPPSPDRRWARWRMLSVSVSRSSSLASASSTAVTPRSRASPLVIIKDEYGGCIIIIRDPWTPLQAHPAPHADASSSSS